MNTLKYFYLVLAIGLGSLLSAQTAVTKITPGLSQPTGYWLSGSLGHYFTADGSSPDQTLSPASLSLSYQRPLTNKLSLLGGVGVQYRKQEIITATGEPCVFPLGIKVITFTDAERYTTHQTEAFLKAGVVYHLNHFGIGVSLLPTMRLSDQINYRFFRNFTIPDRPDTEINVTIQSGETVDRSAVGDGPRSIQYANRVNLQAELTLTYLITPKLQLGLALRPLLTTYNLEIVNQSFCTPTLCTDFSGTAETIGSLRGTAALVQISYGF